MWMLESKDHGFPVSPEELIYLVQVSIFIDSTRRNHLPYSSAQVPYLLNICVETSSLVYFFFELQRLLKRLQKTSIFVENRPGKKWIELFEGRHPEISLQTFQQLTVARSNITKKMILTWFSEVEKYLRMNSLFEILDHPTRVGFHFS